LLESGADSATKRKTVISFLAGRDEALKIGVDFQTPAQAYAQYRADRERHQISIYGESATKKKPLPPLPTSPNALVPITQQNYKRVKYTKDSWQWMKEHGVKPQKKGWNKRLIGRHVPAAFLRT
jgi:hypothetical protein